MYKYPGRILRTSLARTLNHRLDNAFVKLKTFKQYYGKDVNIETIIPSETISIPDLASFPLLGFSKYLRNYNATYVSPPGTVTVLSDVLYDPSSNILFTPEREVLVDSILPFHPFISGKYRVNNNLQYGKNGRPFWWNFSQTKVENISGCYSIFRGQHYAFWHTLLTDIPRVVLLEQSKTAKLESDLKLLFQDNLDDTENFFLPKLLPPNVELCPVRGDRLYRIDKLIFPSYVNQQSFSYLPRLCYEKLCAASLPDRGRRKGKRIYFSRKEFSTRHIINEDDLFFNLEKLGFVKYGNLDGVPIKDKLELFYDAEIVVGADSSGFANILFSEYVKVLTILPVRGIHPYIYSLVLTVGGNFEYWHPRQESVYEYDGGPLGDPLLMNFSVNVQEVMDLVIMLLAT